MPRKARVKDDYGTYYIYQKSNPIYMLFRHNNDRDKFLNILSKTQKKYQYKILAYCILSPTEYHLVINVNGGDISKIMKSINITYAIYRKCKDKLFKDRYHSILLQDENKIKNIIRKIHQKYQNNTKYNSYCVYNGYNKLNIEICLNQRTIINDKQNCLKTLEEAKNKLDAIAISNNLKTEDILCNKQYRNHLLKEFRRHSTLSLKELGQIFGGLSESTVCKILNKEKENLK